MSSSRLATLLLPIVAADYPPNAAKLTLYHEFPAQYQSVSLANQNTGDLNGDAYFVLRGFMLPVECMSKDPEAAFDCKNPEQNASSTNLISKSVVAVDQDYGEYGECNAVLGQYHCRCGPFTKMHPCNASVGRADVSTRYDGVRPPAEDWKWWRVNLAKKIGGYWYSTIKDGECSADASAACTWKVLSKVRTITSRCLLNHVASAVAAYNASCFLSCPQPTNTSSPCWARCLMSAVLGPDGGSRAILPGEGMPLQSITGSFEGAFAAVDAGGCPDALSAEAQHEPSLQEAISASLGISRHDPNVRDARLDWFR
jgi:hypothetical protein